MVERELGGTQSSSKLRFYLDNSLTFVFVFFVQFRDDDKQANRLYCYDWITDEVKSLHARAVTSASRRDIIQHGEYHQSHRSECSIALSVCYSAYLSIPVRCLARQVLLYAIQLSPRRT